MAFFLDSNFFGLIFAFLGCVCRAWCLELVRFGVWGWHFFGVKIFWGLVFAFLGCVCRAWCL